MKEGYCAAGEGTEKQMKNLAGWKDELIAGSDYLPVSHTHACTHKHTQVWTNPRLLMFPAASLSEDETAAKSRDSTVMLSVREQRG